MRISTNNPNAVRIVALSGRLEEARMICDGCYLTHALADENFRCPATCSMPVVIYRLVAELTRAQQTN